MFVRTWELCLLSVLFYFRSLCVVVVVVVVVVVDDDLFCVLDYALLQATRSYSHNVNIFFKNTNRRMNMLHRDMEYIVRQH